jgi:predicted transcriptional regulator
VDWFKFAQNWWWVVITGLYIIKEFRAYILKKHGASEVLKTVAAHDKKLEDISKQYDKIQAANEELQESVSTLGEDLKTHIVEQKSETRQIFSTLYCILDAMKKISGAEADADAAQKDLRKFNLG